MALMSLLEALIGAYLSSGVNKIIYLARKVQGGRIAYAFPLGGRQAMQGITTSLLRVRQRGERLYFTFDPVDR